MPLARRFKTAVSVLALPLLFGCANDMIVDLGKGDAIRLIGQADNFDCQDPAYAKVNKVETFHLVFHDGTKTLCRDADATQRPMKAPPVPMAPSAGSIQTRPLPPGSSAAMPGASIGSY